MRISSTAGTRRSCSIRSRRQVRTSSCRSSTGSSKTVSTTSSSHTRTVPHAGGTGAVRAEYDPTVIAPRYGDDHELYRLDDARLVGEGDSIALGKYVVDFHEATFLDAPVSLWMSERTEGMLFTVDWMGFPHLESERLRFVDELDAELDGTRLLQFHGRVLFWHQYVDVEKVQREIERVKHIHDPEMILPAHGLVIREDPDASLELMKDVVAEIERRNRIGALG